MRLLSSQPTYTVLTYRAGCLKMPNCSSCYAPNPDPFNFCSTCGHQRQQVEKAPSAMAAPLSLREEESQANHDQQRLLLDYESQLQIALALSLNDLNTASQNAIGRDISMLPTMMASTMSEASSSTSPTLPPLKQSIPPLLPEIKKKAPPKRGNLTDKTRTGPRNRKFIPQKSVRQITPPSSQPDRRRRLSKAGEAAMKRADEINKNSDLF